MKIYDRLEIAAGQSRYQIVQQPGFTTKSKLLNDRRGDLMLLINGMPVIHSGIFPDQPIVRAGEALRGYPVLQAAPYDGALDWRSGQAVFRG